MQRGADREMIILLYSLGVACFFLEYMMENVYIIIKAILMNHTFVETALYILKSVVSQVIFKFPTVRHIHLHG